MSREIINEVTFFFYSFAMGIIITFTYDWLLILRRLVKHKIFFISLEDLAFWIACAIAVFYMLYHENNGILRWFAVLGAAIGMLAYRRLLGRHFVPFMSKVLGRLFHVIYKVICLICKPVRKFLVRMALFFKRISKKVVRIVKVFKKKLTVVLKLLKISLCKRRAKEQ